MAQTTFRANLDAANFPYFSPWMGRSIIIPQYDENFQRRAAFSGDDPDLDIGIPQIFFCQNAMPVGQGMTSVAYTQFIPPAPDSVTFDRIVGITDVNLRRAFLASTTSSALYIYSEGTEAWLEITIPNTGWDGKDWTYANANGIPYICLARNGIYTVDITAGTITDAILAGVTNSSADGIFSANNYLLIFSDNLVAWSSALDPTDFVPSTTTGAGSGIPVGLQGKIVAAKALSIGWVAYSTENAVSASYSGNTRFPWVFRVIANAKGVASQEFIAENGDAGTNYTWTTGGLQRVQSATAAVIYPEVTDFLAGRVFEDFDESVGKLVQQFLSSSLNVKVRFVGARFLILSYGITSLTHALVYDTGFKRWGKLKIAHVDCFELVESADGSPISFENSGAAFDETLGAFDEQIALSSDVALAKKTIGFLQANGRAVFLNFDYGNISADGIVILGKYQLTRSELCSFQQLDVECVDLTNNNFSLTLWSTIDGKTINQATVPANREIGDNVRIFNSDIVGMNHSIVFKGAFSLTSVLLTIARHGRM